MNDRFRVGNDGNSVGQVDLVARAVVRRGPALANDVVGLVVRGTALQHVGCVERTRIAREGHRVWCLPHTFVDRLSKQHPTV